MENQGERDGAQHERQPRRPDETDKKARYEADSTMNGDLKFVF